MKRKFPKNRGVYFESDLLISEAFWDLTGAAIKVFMIFRMKCIMANEFVGKRKVLNIVNNGEIIYTFAEACKNHRIPKSTFLRARDQLINVGLIEIAENGGTHHTNKYAISNNWWLYPEQTFERTKSSNLVGKKTRFKKRPPRS